LTDTEGRDGYMATKSILLTGAAIAVLAWPQLAAARPASDARVKALEAEVADLKGEVEALKTLAAHAAAPAAPVPTPAAQAEVEELRAQVADLKAQTAAGLSVVRDEIPSTTVSLAGGRPTFATADGRFSATLHAVMQLDAAAYDQGAAGPAATDLRRSGPALGASASNVDLAHARQLKDGVDFRRARLGIDGTAFGDWDYRLTLDFGGTGVENSGQVYETWVQYSGLKPFKFRVGAFSPSIGLEDQGSTNGMPFLERPAVSDLARGLAAGDTRINAEAFANGDHWLISGAVTGRTVAVVSTGTAGATAQTFSDQLGFVGRLAASPWHGQDWLIHVGAHGSYVDRPASATGPATSGATPLTSYVIGFSNTQELRVDGTKLINTGAINARHADTLGLEFAAQKANLLLQGEYEHFDVQRADPGLADPHFQGWYVEGTWILTGEARRYNPQTAAFDAPPVARPFSLKSGTWGAWELGLRYSEIDLNFHEGAHGVAPTAEAIRGGAEQNFTAGVNWYLNPVVRFMLDYEHVHIDRLSPNAALYQTPVGAQIGQSYNAIALRSQFAF
jgi:phosphate-selective porin OprO/OprP